MKVLIPSDDHSYREATVRKVKVVYNKQHKEYSEYHGDEYLEEGDAVVEMEVAE
jgi:hypothetical protein